MEQLLVAPAALPESASDEAEEMHLVLGLAEITSKVRQSSLQDVLLTEGGEQGTQPHSEATIRMGTSKRIRRLRYILRKLTV